MVRSPRLCVFINAHKREKDDQQQSLIRLDTRRKAHTNNDPTLQTVSTAGRRRRKKRQLAPVWSAKLHQDNAERHSQHRDEPADGTASAGPGDGTAEGPGDD